MPRKRLLRQLFLSFAAIICLSLLAATWFASQTLEQTCTENAQGRLAFAARLAADQAGDAFSGDPAESIRAANRIARYAGARITLIRPDGQVLGDSDNETAHTDDRIDPTQIAAALAGREDRGIGAGPTPGERMLYATAPVRRQEQVVGVVRATAGMADVDRELSAARWSVLGGAALIAIVAGALGLLLARRAARPVEEISRGARRYVRGELDDKLPVPDVDELASLAESLNQLADQLEERGHAIGRQGHEQQAVLASMVEGVLAVDPEERVISLNRAAADLIGSKAAEMRGRSLQEVLRNADLRRFARSALSSQQPVEDDMTLRGEPERILHLRGTALRDEAGHSVGAVIVLNDVTQIRQLETLRRDFVANVSHELKTPIASIKGFVETLLDGALEHPEDAVRFLQIIAKQADRLNTIIEDLLALSRIERAEEAADLPLEAIGIREILLAAIADCQSLAAERSIEVQLSCDEEIEAAVNPPLLEQAIVNLLDNAIKYSEPGTAIRLTAAAAEAEVLIAVSDNGSGIEPEHLPRLFERFYRVDKGRSRKLGGTGLGLAIVKHIVQAHGGQVTVASTFGQGSTFTIHLPAAAA